MPSAIDARPAPLIPNSLSWLVATHLVAGGGAATCLMQGVAPAAAETFLDALLGAELGLLGIWAGLGEHSKTAGFAAAA
ncbi:MAG TPA: hypothetical protein VMV10_08970 [Pirellulales bacterium]|nr:hypothetical protein [Pirellulales bacterium]